MGRWWSGVAGWSTDLGGSYTVPPISPHGTSGSGQVQLDHAAGVQIGDSRVLDLTNTFRVGIPAGDYLGAVAHLDFLNIGTNEVDLEIFDSSFSFIDFDTTIASATSLTASVGAFTVPVGGGFVRMQYGTSVDPNEILVTSYLQVTW